ncbi:acyltransferase family protein [Vagococcus fluvialis]|uniref:acyltransferase family protein n=1 Tax=Vagococcus fluvialis TaxID=2738 RepID=UPI003B5B8906
MRNKRKYITGIDGLRSIAVIGVILYHLTPRFMPGGFLGVTLFFVISGYLMTDILLTEWQERQKIGLKQFYVKRARRIYPSLFVLFIVTGSSFLFISKDLLNNFKQIVTSSLLNVNNFWQIMNGSSYFDRFGNESPFTHLWSLSIEGQFYLIWPILVAFLVYKQKNHQRLSRFILFTTMLSGILMIAFYNPDNLNRLYYGTDTRLFSILIGAYLAIYLRDHEKRIAALSEGVKLTICIASIIGIGTSFIFLKDSNPFVYQGFMFIFSVMSALLLGVVIASEKSNRLLTNPLFKWIGTRSYEIYLWQFPVMIGYEKMIKWDGSNVWFHLLLQFVMILLLSELTYRLVMWFRHHVVFSKEWFSKVVTTTKGKAGLGLTAVLLVTFVVSLAVAPSGRTNASVALEKKLLDNQKMIEKQEATKEKETKETTTSSETKTSETKESQTKEETEKPKQPDKDLIKLSDKETNYLKTVDFSAIGDSVLLSAAPEIKAIFPSSEIDAEVGRQLMDSEPVFKKASKDNKLGDVVLVVLGTNGSFTTKEMEDIMAYLTDKEVFFVNTMVQRPWQKAVNEELAKTAKNHENVHIIDWKKYSNGMAEWFDVDDVHLTPVGAENFSYLIGKEIYDVLNK